MKRIIWTVAAACLATGTLLAAPASASVDFSKPQITTDQALHIVVPATLSDSSGSPKTTMKFSWKQFDESGKVFDYSTSPNTTVGTFSDVRTTFTFTGKVGDYYGLQVNATDCSTNHNSSDAYAYGAVQLGQEGQASYSPGWRVSNCNCFSGGGTEYSAKAGATATYQYTGEGVGLVTEKASNRGSADIFVDGVKKATINNNGASVNRAVAFSAYFNNYSQHTLQIKVRSGRIDVDGFLLAS
jgi:hypothetical protein